MEMAGLVKLEDLPVPVGDGGRAAAGAGALASLSSELVSLEEGRRGLLRGTSCSASVVQTPAAHETHHSPQERHATVRQEGRAHCYDTTRPAGRQPVLCGDRKR